MSRGLEKTGASLVAAGEGSSNSKALRARSGWARGSKRGDDTEAAGHVGHCDIFVSSSKCLGQAVEGFEQSDKI